MELSTLLAHNDIYITNILKGIEGIYLIFKEDDYMEETRKKMSEAHKGKHLSEETRRKISIANKGKNNPNYGKHLSEEHKRKIGKSNKGKHLSVETKRKIGESNKGKHHSEETRRKMSEAHKGKKHPFYGKHLSEEHKRNISLAKRGQQYNIKPPLSKFHLEKELRFYFPNKMFNEETEKYINNDNYSNNKKL